MWFVLKVKSLDTEEGGNSCTQGELVWIILARYL